MRGISPLQSEAGLEGVEQPLDVGGVVVRSDRDAEEPPALPLEHRHLDAVLRGEPPLELLGVARRQLRRPHLRRWGVADGRQAVVEGRSQPPAALEVERAMRLDRRRHREHRGRIARALPAVPVDEAAVGAVPPRDDERLDPTLMLRPRPEEARALRRREPLVAVARVDVGAEPVEVERDVTRRMSAVDNGERARLTRGRADLRHRHEQRRRRRDVAHRHDLRPRPDRVDDLVRLGVDEVSPRRTPRCA